MLWPEERHIYIRLSETYWDILSTRIVEFHKSTVLYVVICLIWLITYLTQDTHPTYHRNPFLTSFLVILGFGLLTLFNEGNVGRRLPRIPLDETNTAYAERLKVCKFHTWKSRAATNLFIRALDHFSEVLYYRTARPSLNLGPDAPSEVHSLDLCLLSDCGYNAYHKQDVYLLVVHDTCEYFCGCGNKLATREMFGVYANSIYPSKDFDFSNVTFQYSVDRAYNQWAVRSHLSVLTSIELKIRSN